MRLVMVVLANAQADAAVEALLEAGQRVTRLASTGGLIRQGNTTLIIGVEEGELDRALQTVQTKAPGALAIVLPLERYERF